MSDVARRASVYAALGDPARLRIADILSLGDASPSELAAALDMPSNLLAHHLKVLREVGLVSSHRSQGDGRRQYLRLTDRTLLSPDDEPIAAPGRVVFVCTANSARSHLAAALWRQASRIPAASAGTHPGERIDPEAIDAAVRHEVPLPRIRPRPIGDVLIPDDLVITVCDLAHEQLPAGELHWSIPDPVRVGTPEAFDSALADIEARVLSLAPRLAS